MKKSIILGYIVAILLFISCSLTLPGTNKNKFNKNGLFALLLGAVMNAETSFLLVPNSDTTMPNLSVIKHNSVTNTNQLQINLVLESNPGDLTATINDHIFANLTNSNKVAVINVNAGGARLAKYLDSGSRPVHIYQDPAGKIWTMNDGNSGVDNVNTTCNASSVASVTVIQDGLKGAADVDTASVLKNICVGKGHHKAFFTASPKRAFISNITDSTISVIDNDPTSSAYLTVVITINLGSGAGPHGFGYSSISGSVYIAARSAGTVIAVNPSTLTTTTIATLQSGQPVTSSNGQYLLFPGRDTMTNTNHVIGKITVLNASTHAFSTVNIPDVSPDHMMFSPDGKKIYVASAQAGSGNQVTNLKQNVLLVYDSSNLPNLTFMKEITVGDAKTGHRHLAGVRHGSVMHVFVPAGDGFLYTVDPATDTVSQKLELKGTFSRAFFHTLGTIANHSH